MTDLVVHSKYKRRSKFTEFHKRTQRWAILVCHRRADKTVATLNDLIKHVDLWARLVLHGVNWS